MTERSRPRALDDADRRLIELLMQDGRASTRALAREVGLTETTVASRIRRLAADDVLSVTAVLDREAAGWEWQAVARITVEGRALREVAEEVAALPEAFAVSLVFGRVDIVAHFMLRDRAHVHELVVDRLSSVVGARDVHIDMITATLAHRFGVATFPVAADPVLELPDPVTPVDELDRAIIAALVRDGRQSNREIARNTDVSEGTIRSRLRAMQDAGLLRIVALVDPVALGVVGSIAFVDLAVEEGAFAAVSRQLTAFPEVMNVDVVVGARGLLLTIGAPDQATLIELVTQRLRAVEGIRTTETLEVIEVVKHLYHWVRFIDTDGSGRVPL